MKTPMISSFCGLMLFLCAANTFAITATLPPGYSLTKCITHINPQGLAFGPDGALYVKHWFGDDVYVTRFSEDGYKTIYVNRGMGGMDQGQMAFDQEGNLFVACGPRNAVYMITASPMRLITFAFDNYPYGVAYKDGYLYVVTSDDGIIWKLNPQNGAKQVFADTTILGIGTSRITRLQCDPDGYLLASSSADPLYEIIKIDESGNMDGYFGNDVSVYLFNPRDMVFQGNGDLFVASMGWHNGTDGRIWLVGSDKTPDIFAGFHDDAISRVGLISLAMFRNEYLFVGFGVWDNSDLSVNILTNRPVSIRPIVFKKPTKPRIEIRDPQ